MKTKVLIIGAGPAGAMAAYRLTSSGFRDVIVVDRSDFPRMKPCAGGISPASHRFLKRIGLDGILSELTPSAAMKRLRLIGPSGRSLMLSSSLKAVTINRKIFDAAMLDRARACGAEFIPGFTVRELYRDDRGRVSGAGDGNRRIDADVTVMATGGRNREFREKYFADKRPLRIIASRIGWWRDFDLEEDTMEMVFDRQLLPHYGWVFPEGDGVVNIGVCAYEDRLGGRNVATVFQEFLDTYYGARLSHAAQVGRSFSFVINTSGSVGRVYADRVLYAGEAGRLCNPATAEGISYAMESGMLAADACLRAFERGTGGEPAENELEDYESQCRRSFNFRLRRASLFSRLAVSPAFQTAIDLSTSPLAQKIVSRVLGSA